MTTKTASKEGVTAYNEGRHQAPALNNKFIAAACKSDSDLNELLDAYLNGWTIAHLANNTEDDTMPSVIKLKAILAA